MSGFLRMLCSAVVAFKHGASAESWDHLLVYTLSTCVEDLPLAYLGHAILAIGKALTCPRQVLQRLALRPVGPRRYNSNWSSFLTLFSHIF